MRSKPFSRASMPPLPTSDCKFCSRRRSAPRWRPPVHAPFPPQREPGLPIEIERPQAAFASWYELFPRSATDDPHRPGRFDDVVALLPTIRDMGFDVLYFPPIHPIGTTNRKGRNNSLRP